MGLLDEWINAVKSVDPFEVLKETMLHFHAEIIELNQEQLDKGEKSTGERLSPYSTPYKKYVRQRLGLQTTNKDLNVTGKFRDDMYANPTQLYTIVGSRDFKEKFLEKMEGKEIFGLNEKNLNYLFFELGALDYFVNLYTQKVSDL
jgi:hypothetical protein